MPTYEYVCRDCGHAFEIVQSMKDDALTVCPECGGSLRKVFAPPAIAFKGSGFYATDHGKKAKPKGESTDAAEKKPAAKESPGEAKVGSKSPSKDAATPPAGDTKTTGPKEAS